MIRYIAPLLLLPTLSLAGGGPGPGGLSVTVNQTAPGADMEVIVGFANPGERVIVGVSNGDRGTGPCPPLLGGNCVGFEPGTSGYQILADTVADANGQLAVLLEVPTTLAPQTLRLQAFAPDGTDTLVSDVLDVVVHPSCPTDALEGGDVDSSAELVPSGAAGSLSVCEGDADVIAVDVPDGHTLRAWWTVETPGGISALLRFSSGATGSTINSGQGVLDRTNSSGTTDTMTIRTSVSNPGVLYDLRWQVYDASAQNPCATDAFGNIGEQEQAVSIAPGRIDDLTACGTSAGSEVDWFTFDADAGDALDVRASHDELDGVLSLQILDDAQTVSTSTSVSGLAASTWVAPATGTYWIAVSVVDDLPGPTAGGVPYALELGLITP